MRKNPHNGFAIVVSWPDTMCKQAGAWYDGLMEALNFSENNYYKVGHAAVVLIEQNGTECHYFDFGRYHTPFGYGRVRSVETDHDLRITTPPVILNNEIVNYEEILSELLANPSCHGTGKIYASYCSINFSAALKKAKEMQDASPLAYGPFTSKGTNCSRFVRSIALAGKPKLNHQFLLLTPYSISPSPKTNVDSFKNKITLFPSEEVLEKTISL